MSALDAVRKRFSHLGLGADKTDKSPSVSSVSCSDRKTENFVQLPADLRCRLHAMASRWSYTRDERVEVLALATRNPDGWLQAVAMDERRFGSFDRRLTSEEIQEAMCRGLVQ